MQELQETTTLDEIATPDVMVKHYPETFTLTQIKWLLRNRHKNGLQKAGAVLLVGRQFYINQPKFTDWLLSQKS